MESGVLYFAALAKLVVEDMEFIKIMSDEL